MAKFKESSHCDLTVAFDFPSANAEEIASAGEQVSVAVSWKDLVILVLY